MTAPTPRVGILLSTYNGARYLSAQLDSLRRQQEPGWRLFWRDDGSTDGTVALMEDFTAGLGAARCVRVATPGRLGASGSFFALMQAAKPLGLPLAFADQDDVWLPEKLTRALDALDGQAGPILYCSRQTLVDEALTPLGDSALLRRAPDFPAALTQNIATGCTVVLNPAAAALLARSQPPDGPLHDWWSYLLVTAAGGRVIADPHPTVLYRQHRANLVGAPSSRAHRAMGALRRGPDAYMAMLRSNVAALLAEPELLTAQARRTLAVVDGGLRGGVVSRLRALGIPGLRRQTWSETALFRWWFLRG